MDQIILLMKLDHSQRYHLSTVHVCARVAPSRKRAAMFTGNTVDSPRPGRIASRHLTVASTTSSVLKPLRFVTLPSMSLKTSLLIMTYATTVKIACSQECDAGLNLDWSEFSIRNLFNMKNINEENIIINIFKTIFDISYCLCVFELYYIICFFVFENSCFSYLFYIDRFV